MNRLNTFNRINRLNGPGKQGGISWSSYWTTQNIFDFLWMGTVVGDELIDISGNENNLIITNKDFTGIYIPATTSATFAIPDDATLKADDTNLFWHEADGDILQKSAADLVANDLSRTIIKYDNDAPYHVRWIGILKSAVTLTEEQINKLHQSFELWLFWNSTLNAYGVIKANRLVTSIPTVISAAIASTVPDKVVVTFDQALDETSVPATSDFAIEGKTISNVAVTGSTAILTVTVAYAYGDSGIAVSYTKPAVNGIKSSIDGSLAASFTDQAVTNNLLIIYDGNTWGEYDYLDTSTISETGGLVTQLKDRQGSGHDLNSPLVAGRNASLEETGILFDGVANRLFSNIFAGTLDQPHTAYVVLKQITWTQYDKLVQVGGTAVVQISSTPQIYCYAGTFNTARVSPTLDTYCILRIVSNGSSSSVQLNNAAAVAGDFGTTNAGVFAVGSASGGTADWSNIEFKGAIVRSVLDDATTRDAIYDFLKTKYGL